mmetsp:Transcript_7452/g.13413  ORF Transcript_7452/g.13413 Transcript_7452/m.13413 type:complete len:216 (+) Transcript_7452:1696-2343(+)
MEDGSVSPSGEEMRTKTGVEELDECESLLLPRSSWGGVNSETCFLTNGGVFEITRGILTTAAAASSISPFFSSSSSLPPNLSLLGIFRTPVALSALLPSFLFDFFGVLTAPPTAPTLLGLPAPPAAPTPFVLGLISPTPPALISDDTQVLLSLSHRLSLFAPMGKFPDIIVELPGRGAGFDGILEAFSRLLFPICPNMALLAMAGSFLAFFRPPP